jgi:p-cumate 2,3-dioxygenase beta subunit
VTAIETTAVVTAGDVEAFLYEEAALLDEWRLEEWLTLFEPDAMYFVPATDRPDGDPNTDQFLIVDTYAQIVSRVGRLNSRNAHAERPRSRTRRFVTNTRIASVDEEGVHVTASFIIYRIKDRVVAPYIGQYRHVLTVVDGALRFKVRKAVLDLADLGFEGRISFVL